jgi:hypothetical protein
VQPSSLPTSRFQEGISDSHIFLVLPELELSQVAIGLAKNQLKWRAGMMHERAWAPHHEGAASRTDDEAARKQLRLWQAW